MPEPSKYPPQLYVYIRPEGTEYGIVKVNDQIVLTDTCSEDTFREALFSSGKTLFFIHGMYGNAQPFLRANSKYFKTAFLEAGILDQVIHIRWKATLPLYWQDRAMARKTSSFTGKGNT